MLDPVWGRTHLYLTCWRARGACKACRFVSTSSTSCCGSGRHSAPPVQCVPAAGSLNIVAIVQPPDSAGTAAKAVSGCAVLPAAGSAA